MLRYEGSGRVLRGNSKVLVSLPLSPLRHELLVVQQIGDAVRVHRGHPDAGVAGLVAGNRLEVPVHFAFGGFHPEAWRR